MSLLNSTEWSTIEQHTMKMIIENTRITESMLIGDQAAYSYSACSANFKKFIEKITTHDCHNERNKTGRKIDD
jgi:hypothetical protein